MEAMKPIEIADLRRNFRLTRKALGDLLGVSGHYIYYLERGMKTPSKTLLFLLHYVMKDLQKKGGEKTEWPKEGESISKMGAKTIG
jgi:DNA-binding transcriptional regulator YiaG